MTNILVCDDEKDIVRALKIYLSAEGYNVIEAYNGIEAIEKLNSNDIKLVLMDVMMPQMDGIDATMKIRESSNVPIILLTAKSEYSDKILGLQIGADDYITKPFNPIEVVARVKSQIRRYTALGSVVEKNENILINGGISIDDKAKNVYLDGEKLQLTPTEYAILKFFTENVGEVFSPKEIYKKIWEDDPYGSEGTVLVHIRHLREKMEIDPSNPRYIVSVWGHGYKMEKR